MMVESQRAARMDVMANATNAIAEGEVLQLLNCGDPDTDEARYMRVIELKTARLFEAGCRLGAITAERDGAVQQQLHDRSEEHTSELLSLMSISYAVFCLKKKKLRTY